MTAQINKLSNLEKIDLFKASRFMYMSDNPIISDNDYDDLKLEIEKIDPNLRELNQVYENDILDYDALIRAGIERQKINEFILKRGITSEFSFNESVALANEDNLSIISHKTDEDTIKAFKDLGNGTYVFSPKVDGIFLSAIYEREQGDTFRFKIGKSRGSTSEAVDVTVNLQFFLPSILNIPNIQDNSIKLRMECYMDERYLDETGYVTPKSGASGVMLAIVNRKPELFKYLRVILHGNSFSFNTLEEYENLKGLNIDSVPYAVIDVDDETNIMSLTDQLNLEFREWASLKNARIDGIVAKKQDNSLRNKSHASSKIYNVDTFAIKRNFWVNGTYKSIVSDIKCEAKDSEYSYTIIVEKVQTSSNKVSRLTNINLSTLLNSNIWIGDTVEFEYLNETTPKFIRKVED